LAISAGSLLTDIRIQFGDPDRDFITDAIGLEWLTEGQERFCHEVMPLDEVGDFSVTSGVKRYDLPTNCIIPFTGVYWKNARRELAAVDPSEWDTYEARRILSSGTPCVFSVIRQQLVIGPAAPSGNSATALASGAITAAATTIGLTAASGTFRSRGWIKNQTTGEVVEYTGVSTTELTGCIRGVHGTSAASCASGEQFKEIDLQIRYRRSPTPMTATTQNPDIQTAFHRYLKQYVLFLAWRARGDKAKADAAYTQFEQEEKRAKDTVGRRIYAPRFIKDRRYSGGRGLGWGDGM
jgi:hypothetical protein